MFIVNFLFAHPIFSISVIGSTIGMLLWYIAPCFTRDYLCADEDFCLGNLGIAVFIHKGFGHYFGNLFFMIPGSLLCESFYNNTTVLIIILVFSFVDCMRCIPMGSASCGYSGVAYMLCSMACMQGLHWWGFVIYAILFLAGYLMDRGAKTDVFSHVLGFLAGGVIGFILQIN